MKKPNQSGFALAVILIPIVLIIIGLIGAIVWRNQQPAKTSTSTSQTTSASETGGVEICGSDCIEDKLGNLVTFIEDGIQSKDLTGDPDLTSGLPKTLTSGGETVDTKGITIYVDMSSGAFCVSNPNGSRYKTVTNVDPDIRTSTKRCKSATDSPV